MKSITGFALGLAAVLAVPAVFADNTYKSDTKVKSSSTTSTDTTSTTGTTTESATSTDSDMSSTPTTTESTTTTSDGSMATGTYGYGGGPTTTTTATTTTTSNDYYVHDPVKDDDHRHVRSGLGLNVMGTAGTQENARLGLGGRLEYVTKIGLTLGGSFTQHFTSEADRTAIRPLLGEVGWAIPVVDHLEVRPMVGLGYAFASATRAGDVNRPSDSQNTNASTTVNAGGVDIAPGAKVSYVARSLEIFTMPKYHFISGSNFAGIELGAGARF
jgi:hypothetical protein